MRRATAQVTLLLVALLATGGASPPGLRFDQIFATRGEPARIHYQVTFASAGAGHRLEVWRDGDRRLKRVTDGVIAAFADHAPGDAGYTMTVLDRRRRISTRISRTNLYRIGQFTDWFDLGHGLRRPKASYNLNVGHAPKGLLHAIAPCVWYDLSQHSHVTQVCWSSAERLPLVIAADRRPVWRVTAIDHSAFAPALFTVDDRGYVHNDANRDIERD